MTNGGGDSVSQWICCSCCQPDDFININYNKLLITFPAFFNVRSQIRAWTLQTLKLQHKQGKEDLLWMDFSGVRVQSFVPTASVSLCANGDIITQPEPFMLATAFAATANGTRLQKSRGSSSAKTNSGLFSPSVRFVCADVNTVITAKQLHRDHLEEVVLARSQTDYEACLW